MDGSSRPIRGGVAPVALFLLLVAPACQKVISLALEGKERDAGTTVDPTPRNAPPPAPVATGPAVEEDDEPPVHMPHVPTGAPSATAKAPPSPAETHPPTCAGACRKTLECMGAYSASEQSACVAECSKNHPNPSKLAELVRKDCTALLTSLKGGGNHGSSGGNANANKGSAASSACKADCYGCVWDGTSCYYLNGSMVGAGTVYCADCCCAKGGPAKRWE